MNNDGAFEAFADKTIPEYRLTLIDSRTLIQRLATEISFAAYRIHQLWPELKKDPIGFGLWLPLVCKERIQNLWLKPNKLMGDLAAALIVSLAFLLAFLAQSPGPSPRGPTESAEAITKIITLNISAPMNRIGSGIGAGSQGRVGISSGRGEGAKREARSSRGGGGSGNLNTPKKPDELRSLGP